MNCILEGVYVVFFIQLHDSLISKNEILERHLRIVCIDGMGNDFNECIFFLYFVVVIIVSGCS